MSRANAKKEKREGSGAPRRLDISAFLLYNEQVMTKGKEREVKTFVLSPRGERGPHAASVVALGFFDGVHTAHAAVLGAAARIARERALPLLVYTFASADSPKAAALLSTDAEKLSLLGKQGADLAVLAEFSEVSALSPEAFVRDVLVGELHAAVAVTGEDFRFGHGASGDTALLASLLSALGGETVAVPSVLSGGEKVSSSAVRRALADGDPERARVLLGRPYSLTLPVLTGRHIGHTLGFPTANQSPPEGRAIPAFGVYVTAVTTEDGARYLGVTDIGTRPTVGGAGVRLETHLLDFSGDLYGRPLTVSFLHRIRGERKFSSVSALAEQITSDCKEARKWSKLNGSN